MVTWPSAISTTLLSLRKHSTVVPCLWASHASCRISLVYPDDPLRSFHARQGRREFTSLQADFAERQHLVRQGSVDKRAADAPNDRVARIPADPAAVVLDPAAARARLAVRRCAEGAEEVAGRV